MRFPKYCLTFALLRALMMMLSFFLQIFSYVLTDNTDFPPFLRKRSTHAEQKGHAGNPIGK